MEREGGKKDDFILGHIVCGKNTFTEENMSRITKITVPVELGKDDIENLAQELEVQESSTLSVFIETLLKSAAKVLEETQDTVTELCSVNPFSNQKSVGEGTA